MKLVSLKEASSILGISVMTLRRRIYAGSIPYTRSNADKTGKILLDVDLVKIHLLNEALNNMKTSGGFVDSEPVIDYDPSFGTDEAPPSMANVANQFPRISQDDVNSGWFGADTLTFKPTDEPTSETLTLMAPKKP